VFLFFHFLKFFEGLLVRREFRIWHIAKGLKCWFLEVGFHGLNSKNNG
jgi:hypothetical protein